MSELFENKTVFKKIIEYFLFMLITLHVYFFQFRFPGKDGFWLTRKVFFDFVGRKSSVFGHISSTEYVPAFQTWISPTCSSNRLPVDVFESWVWIAMSFLKGTNHTRRLPTTSNENLAQSLKRGVVKCLNKRLYKRLDHRLYNHVLEGLQMTVQS